MKLDHYWFLRRENTTRKYTFIVKTERKTERERKGEMLNKNKSDNKHAYTVIINLPGLKLSRKHNRVASEKQEAFLPRRKEQHINSFSIVGVEISTLFHLIVVFK